LIKKKDSSGFFEKKNTKMAAPSPLRDECARLSRHAEKLAIMHRAFYFQRAGPWELFARFSGNAMWNYGVSKDFLRLSVRLERCAAGKGTDESCQTALNEFERLDRMTAEAMR
jgi:hypothetical protein